MWSAIKIASGYQNLGFTFYYSLSFSFSCSCFFSIISLYVLISLFVYLSFFTPSPCIFFIAFLQASLASSVKLIIAVSRGSRCGLRHKHSETIPNFAYILLLSLQISPLKYCKTYQTHSYWHKDITNAAYKHITCKLEGRKLLQKQSSNSISQTYM